jgi:uncharacterized protein (TIGR02246 family)
MKNCTCLAAVAIIGVLLLAASQGQPLAGQAAPALQGKDNAGDTTAIKKAGQSFLKAYTEGDAKGMAAHWTENGEYYAEDGAKLLGRAAIEKAYAELFGKKKSQTEADVEITSIRFPSKDTAIEEGYFKVRSGKDAPVVSKYTVLHVREGGKWLMAVVREWPSEGVSLRDLEWLIGTWEAKRETTEIRTTYEWWGDKTFIRVAVSIKQKDKTIDGFMMIGKDASMGQLRSWTFDPDGSFGEGTWTREGNKWLQDSAGVLDDGSVLAATNILTRIDNDTFTFQSVHRTADGEPIGDIAPIRVVRVKTK